MYKIVVESKCSVIVEAEDYYCEHCGSYVEEEVQLDAHDLSKLDNYKFEDNFVEYIDNKQLSEKLLEGYMRLQLQEDELVAVIEYKAVKRLSKAELEELRNYTSGQLSDGIGENIEQVALLNKYYVSTWTSNSNVTIKQTKLN
jgi:hypothetical protein